MLWRQLLKQLLALHCASCEGFSMSGNAVVIVTGTGSKDSGCLQSVGWLESSGLHAYTLPSPLISSYGLM